MEAITNFKFGYILAVVITMTITTSAVMALLKSIERKRLKNLKTKDISEAVETQSPEEYW